MRRGRGGPSFRHRNPVLALHPEAPGRRAHADGTEEAIATQSSPAHRGVFGVYPVSLGCGLSVQGSDP